MVAGTDSSQENKSVRQCLVFAIKLNSSSHGTTLGRIEVVRREWWGLKGSLRHIAREMFKPIISMTNKGLFTRYECRCS